MKESLCAHRQNSIKKRHLIDLIPLFSKRHEEQTSVSSCSDTTITSISSSSSTICNNNTAIHHPRPIIRAKHPSTIPDYATLRKLYLKFQSKPKHRRDLLKEHVAHWFRKNSNDVYFPQLQTTASSFWGIKDAAKEQRRLEFGRFILTKWWRSLLNNISIATQDDKGLNEFLEFDFLGPSQYTEWLQFQEHALVRDYRRLLVASLRLAIGKLNQKAIYSNIIAFSAKVLAICYFKIPGVAISLLRALDSPLRMMHSVHSEMTAHCQQYQQQQRMFESDIQYIFPSFLHTIMTSDRKSYQHCLQDDDMDYSSDLPLRKSGNWIRRWTSDDSELFFLFYRYYHAALKMYMTARYPNLSQLRLYQRNLLLSVSPGYLCLASYFASKLHLLTQREICSVTNGAVGTTNNSKGNCFTASTLSPTNNIQLINEPTTTTTGPGKNMLTSSSIIGKPKPLIMATKRYTECMAWNTVAADPDGLFHDMVNVWLRAVIKKTVLTNPEQVFCLFDILEQTVLELQKYPVKLAYFPIDRPFILQTLNIVLSQCDHSITLLRSLSFIYAHFRFLTAQAALLDTLCNGILMNAFILERLLLHWGKNVRIFFLRCLVWRVSRVWGAENVLWSTEIVDELRDKGNSSHFCNGHECWLRWSSKCCSSQQGTNSEEMQAYQQCALEVHIKLETLMASFHKHYASMQGQPNGHPFAENVLVSTAEPPVESFSSDVAFLLPCDASHQYNKSSPSPGANSENPSTLKSATLKRKHSVMSKLFKHNHGLLVHRLGKEKNVFSPQQTKFSSQEDEALCTMNMDKQTAVREIYTILANGYNIYSLHYPPQWRPAAKVWKSNKQHAAHRDVVSESPFITAIINSWSYGPAKQVYATKVVDELKEIVNEYHVWLQRAPANLVDVGFMAPRLFLEWPKSWAFSTI
ncbi:hypothetical protein FB192DRAFT_1463098 [Mucor lusitanicus]|uniref:DUF1765-domain-containing protein n=2 Tax=Mucor circinelloides f. lusitanicus TaxID=29924 RepID=A0A168HMP5_MUCCL|nr:hypothetical protein FB192DRAFT_1463098 [Mucor lusitanicus]OAC98971.1 hypothetical protein MUCCIDRAFT_115219 [Mucor lusitanicus CBS 277.49]